MRTSLLLLLLLVVGSIATVSILLFASTYTYHDQGAVDFTASLNATTVLENQTIKIDLHEINTLPFKNSLPPSDGLTKLNVTSGPCGGLLPAGIQVYQGAYDLDNLSSSAIVQYFANGTYLCPLSVGYDTGFQFGPSQNYTASWNLVGYWTTGNTSTLDGGLTQGVLHRFEPGTYTIVTGDEWGRSQLLYFHVEPIPGNQEQSGPLSSFPALWLSPCNTTSTGNTTTSVNLGLNGSSSFDHINLDQVYGQIINSPSFAYLTVGHGWVVSQWSEESAQNGNASQVIVSFILTSGDRPVGYFFAYYNPPSGAVALSAATYVGPASCP
jgi:hypothetical protein